MVSSFKFLYFYFFQNSFESQPNDIPKPYKGMHPGVIPWTVNPVSGLENNWNTGFDAQLQGSDDRDINADATLWSEKTPSGNIGNS